MRIRKLDSRGFSHDVAIVLVVVLFGVVGVGYLVASHALTPNTGAITSKLVSGKTNLCLNASGTSSIANDSPINVIPCKSGSKTQSWQVKPTEQTTIGTLTTQAYSINYTGSKYCVGVNAPGGTLALTSATTPKGRHTVAQPLVQLFGCRASQSSFNNSFQQWAVVNGTLVNVNPAAKYKGITMCLTATTSGSNVRLSTCVTSDTGQQWTMPSSTSTTKKPTAPTGVTATAKSPTSVTVSWKASTDAGGPGIGGYYILRGGSQVGSVGASVLTYTDNAVSANTKYSYTIEAHDTATPPVSSTPSAAAVVTTPSSGGGGGGTASCTNPIWNSSDPEATDNIGSGDVWWVSNDAWNGSHGPQTIYACSQSSWYAISNQTNNGGAVETYPDTEYDVAGRGNAKETIAQYKTISSTFSESYPTAGSWDAAYDLWTDNWAHETMIWNQWTGTQLYWPSNKSTTVNLDGVPYWFQANGSELIFYRQNMVTSGSVNILAAYQWEVAHGYAKSTDVPTQLEYGVEVCSTNGAEKFPMNGLTFTVN